ncbi:hypothetical protein [Streptomyces sp. SID8352]|uniref:hypothetical protein n=1 Tax=Streptomyces sp. SID8352 TaxID=2690338 RepID=UPI001367A914|nr:hypothetical protein [Streptomyces sp. SID8352]MYU22358.1 hypothetical protein [Streptomyces sp. SID8352]
MCPCPDRRGGGRRAGGSELLLVWRSDAALGPALLRSRRLPPPGARPAPPHPLPCPYGHGAPPCDEHLWVDAHGPRAAELAVHADVLVSRVPLPPGAARRLVRELLTGHPGCLAAAVPDTAGGCAAGVRAPGGALAAPVRLERYGPVPPQAVASVLHAWTVSGRPPGALRSVSAVHRR